jgi:hypothetical protein
MSHCASRGGKGDLAQPMRLGQVLTRRLYGSQQSMIASKGTDEKN